MKSNTNPQTPLIKIKHSEKGDIVSARELYDFLEMNPSQWTRWYNRNIIKNNFAIENVDYDIINVVKSNNKTKDFAITLDFAKKLSMTCKKDISR